MVKKNNQLHQDSPPVNVSQNPFSLSRRVLEIDVGCHPCNQVVLERAFTDLVEEVWGQQLVNVCTRKARAPSFR
jgi:hypothetical protein